VSGIDALANRASRQRAQGSKFIGCQPGLHSSSPMVTVDRTYLVSSRPGGANLTTAGPCRLKFHR
jgi:hypothetical protein